MAKKNECDKLHDWLAECDGKMYVARCTVGQTKYLEANGVVVHGWIKPKQKIVQAQQQQGGG